MFKKELEAKLNNEELLGQEWDPDKPWQHLKSIIQDTAVRVAGFSKRKNKDWFSENDAQIQNFLQKKWSYHDRLLASNDDQAVKAAYRAACSTLQTQLHADLGNTKALFEALHRAYGPSHQAQAPLR